MRILIINGPNLNTLGKREPEIYGSTTFEEFHASMQEQYNAIQIDYYQSNIEGELVEKIQQSGADYDGVLLNAAAYTHTSVAIHDAIGTIKIPVVEIHISNIYKREEFRHKSVISANCVGMIAGLGLQGYALGIEYLKSTLHHD